MPASAALRLYHQYVQALGRERLAWEQREHLKQQRSLDVAASWEGQRAPERASREQVAAWAAWDAERQANERADAAPGEQAPLPPQPVFSEMAATETVLATGALYEFSHPALGIVGRLLISLNACRRSSITAQIDSLPNTLAWLERQELLSETARMCQQALSECLEMPVAAPSSLVQTQRQVRLCHL